MLTLERDLTAFKKSTFEFMENLQDISADLKILDPKDRKQATSMVYCVKTLMESVWSEIEKFEKCSNIGD